MGLVQRDGINGPPRRGYSGQFDTICTNPA
jgi:hypothetical protein